MKTPTKPRRSCFGLVVSSTALLSCAVIGGCVLLFALAWLMGDTTATDSGPVPPPQPTTYEVTLICQDCFEEGMEINLWATAERDDFQIVGSVPRNTRATVLDATFADNLMRYKVEANGMVGWVSELFIQK